MRFNSLYKRILNENSAKREYALLFDGDVVVRVGEEAPFDPFEDKGAPKKPVTLSMLLKTEGKGWMRMLNGKTMQNTETYMIRFGSYISRTFDITQTIQTDESIPTVTWFNVYWGTDNIETFKLDFKVIDLEEYEKKLVNNAYADHGLSDIVSF